VQTEGASRPWYRKRRYQIPLILIVVVLLVSLLAPLFRGPLPPNQVRLNKVIDYFQSNYNGTVGLIPETPGGHTYWLYSDNYLVILAVSRYDPGNSSTNNFSSALFAAFDGYAVTLPGSLAENQYIALNATLGYFGCPSNHVLTWTGGAGNGSALMMTTANGNDQSCTSQNYADLTLLQALYQHRLGNAAAATRLFDNASSYFDGYGFKDLAYTSPSSTSFQVYQTYKVALYVYATYCLGEQKSATNLAAATAVLLEMQSNSTGGFTTGYTSNGLALGPPVTANGGVNTETTALAALALEETIRPSASC